MMRQLLIIALTVCASGLNLKDEKARGDGLSQKEAFKLMAIEQEFNDLLEPVSKKKSSFLQDSQKIVRKPTSDKLLDADGLILEKSEEALDEYNVIASKEAEYFQGMLVEGDAMDRMDKMERAIEDFELRNFTGKAEEVQSKLPEECVADIKARMLRDEKCADPWWATKDCSKPFEVPNYRLGDLFFELSVSGYSYKQNRDWTSFYFPESVGARYLKIKKQKKDYDALRNVLDSEAFDDYVKPDNNTLVLHLRAYDIYFFGADAGYTKSAAHYKNMANKAKKNGLNKVVIVTGDHWMTQKMSGVTGYVRSNKAITEQAMKRAIEKSDAKRAEIKNTFESAGFSVSERVNGNADCDFVFMANARHFVPSHGNFGGLTYGMVQKAGGTLYM